VLAKPKQLVSDVFGGSGLGDDRQAGNILVAFPNNQTGDMGYLSAYASLFDDKSGNRYHFYLQSKLRFQLPELRGDKKRRRDGDGACEQRPPQTVDEVLAHGLAMSLLQHVSCETGEGDLSTVHFVLYYWGGDDGEEGGAVLPEQTEVLRHLTGSHILQEMMRCEAEKHRQDPEVVMASVVKFISEHFGNIHVVSRPRLQSWLLPSLLPFPILLSALSALPEDSRSESGSMNIKQRGHDSYHEPRTAGREAEADDKVRTSQAECDGKVPRTV
jgi:hypothetical protein